MSKIRVVLVDDHSIMREGLRALLANYHDVEVIGEAQDGEEAVEIAKKECPDVVLMDVAMPGMGGVEATKVILKQNQQIGILVLTQYEDWRYVQSLQKAGALGYISKRALGTDLILAIRSVANGEEYIESSIKATMPLEIKNLVKHQSPSSEMFEKFTAREEEVLLLIARGKTSLEIADILCISVKTVEWHRNNIMSKLNVHRVADVVRYAMKHGLV